MRYGGARCVVVLGPVFVIFNIGFFAFYVRQTVKQLSWPGGTVLLPPCRGAIFCVINKVIYALSDFLIMILSWLVKQSLRAFLFQEVQP